MVCITAAVYSTVRPDLDESDNPVVATVRHKIAPWADVAIGLIAVIFAGLALGGIIPIDANIAKSVLAVGITYLVVSVSHVALQIKRTHPSLSEKFLFNNPTPVPASNE